MRPNPEADIVREALSATVDPETQAKHLAMIQVPLDKFAVLEQAQAVAEDRIHDLENRMKAKDTAVFELRTQVEILTGQANEKPRTDPRYEELRRFLKAAILTEIIVWWQANGVTEFEGDEGNWAEASWILYSRYGHWRFADGTPLWSGPPSVSEKTKTLIAEALKLR